MKIFPVCGAALLGLATWSGCMEVDLTMNPDTEAVLPASAAAVAAQSRTVDAYRQLWEAMAVEYRSGQKPVEELLDPLTNWQLARIRYRQLTTPGVDWAETSVTELWWNWQVANRQVQGLAALHQAGTAADTQLLAAQAEAAEAEAQYLACLDTVDDVAAFTTSAKTGDTLDWMKPEEIAKVLDALFLAEYRNHGKTQ